MMQGPQQGGCQDMRGQQDRGPMMQGRGQGMRGQGPQGPQQGMGPMMRGQGPQGPQQGCGPDMNNRHSCPQSTPGGCAQEEPAGLLR
jgi:hypothetical protein